jgi:hypothetical protein
MTVIKWIKNELLDGEYAETADGYHLNYRKMKGVSLDGYLAGVHAPKWTYTGRFGSAQGAKSWAAKILARDRIAPMVRGPNCPEEVHDDYKLDD